MCCCCAPDGQVPMKESTSEGDTLEETLLHTETVSCIFPFMVPPGNVHRHLLHAWTHSYKRIWLSTWITWAAGRLVSIPGNLQSLALTVTRQSDVGMMTFSVTVECNPLCNDLVVSYIYQYFLDSVLHCLVCWYRILHLTSFFWAQSENFLPMQQFSRGGVLAPGAVSPELVCSHSLMSSSSCGHMQPLRNKFSNQK